MALATLVMAALAGAWPGQTQATTTERVVTNPRTGLAIDGFDPVAYFIDAIAIAGRPGFEFRYHDAVWRFRNTGNRAAFIDNPAHYEPRFGGYDPVGIARGVPSPGRPQIWTIEGQTLYLFFSETTREAFLTDAGRLVRQADAKWPDVIKVLAQ
jgi:hypothetical protein